MWRGLDGGAGTPPGIGPGGASRPGPDTRSPPRTCPRESETPLGARASFPRRRPPIRRAVGAPTPPPRSAPSAPERGGDKPVPEPDRDAAEASCSRQSPRPPVPPGPLNLSPFPAVTQTKSRFSGHLSRHPSRHPSGHPAVGLWPWAPTSRPGAAIQRRRGPRIRGRCSGTEGHPSPSQRDWKPPLRRPRPQSGAACLRRNSGNIRLTLSGLSVSRTRLPASVRPALSEPPRLRPARVWGAACPGAAFLRGQTRLRLPVTLPHKAGTRD